MAKSQNHVMFVCFSYRYRLFARSQSILKMPVLNFVHVFISHFQLIGKAVFVVKILTLG